MVVGEPTLMGGEFGDEDERLITRLENSQFQTGNGMEDPSGQGGPCEPGPQQHLAGPQGCPWPGGGPDRGGGGGSTPGPNPSLDSDKKSPAIGS